MATKLRCPSCGMQYGDPGGAIDRYYCTRCGWSPLVRFASQPPSAIGAAVAGGTAGAAFGAMVGGPLGALIGGVLGSIIGKKASE